MGMNKERRKSLKEIAEQLEILKDALEEVMANEEEARDNIPESLWESERYEKAEAACENLSYAIDSLEEVFDYIEEAMA